MTNTEPQAMRGNHFIMPSPDELRTIISQGLIDILDAAQASDDPAKVARFLAALRDFKADAATVYRDIEAHLLNCMGDRTLEVPGFGVVETHRKTKRTGWDHDSLIADVLDTVHKDEGLPEGTLHVVAAIRECISFGAGKVTGIKERGLQVDEYCKETPEGWTVQLPPRDHEQDVA